MGSLKPAASSASLIRSTQPSAVNVLGRIFKVMLGNVSMSQKTIMDHMTSKKDSNPTQIGQLQNALSMAERMGLLTRTDDEYSFTELYLENLPAITREEDNDVPASTSRPDPMQLTSSAASTTGRAKRSCSSQGPTKAVKRPRLVSPPPKPKVMNKVSVKGITMASRRNARSISTRSSMSSLRSNGSSCDSRPPARKPALTARATRRVTACRATTCRAATCRASACRPTKSGATAKKITSSGGYRKAALPPRKAPLKRKPVKAAKRKPAKSRPKRPVTKNVPAPRSNNRTKAKCPRDLPSKPRGKTTTRRVLKSSPPVKKRNITTKGKASKTSIASSRSGKSRTSQSSCGSGKAVVPKIPSRTSRKSDEPSGSGVKKSGKKSGTSSNPQKFIDKQWGTKTLTRKDSASSVESRRCSNSDDSEGQIPPPKRVKPTAQQGRSPSKRLEAKVSASSFESGPSYVTRATSRTSVGSDDSNRKTCAIKSEKFEKSVESTQNNRDSNSSMETNNESSKHTAKSDGSTLRQGGDDNDRRRSLRIKESSSTIASKRSSISKVSSACSVPSDASYERSRRVKSKPFDGNYPLHHAGPSVCKNTGSSSRLVKQTPPNWQRTSPDENVTSSSRHQQASPRRSEGYSHDQTGRRAHEHSQEQGRRSEWYGHSAAVPRPSKTRFLGHNPINPIGDDDDDDEVDSRTYHDFYK